MPLDLISPNKRLTGVPGRGVQFLPGYPEPFKREIAEFLRATTDAKLVVEIGAGGLSLLFEILDVPTVEKIICADPDSTSLNYHEIIQHYGLDPQLARKINDKCVLMNCDAARFFELMSSDVAIDFLIALRVAHFFSPVEFQNFLRAVYSRLSEGGHMVLSGFGVIDHDNPGRISEFYEHSFPICDQLYYRRLDERRPEARALMREQNLQTDLLFFEENFIQASTEEAGFRVVRGPVRATRIVDGYIFQKRT
jgi:hypothetical protein